jgi:two-component system cell cycle sensor histidine kinase/response regulator CckA
MGIRCHGRYQLATAGLGLSTVYGIVKENCWYVLVYSEPGAGTSFKVYFPQSTDGAPVVDLKPYAASPGGSETILFVEDDKAVRELVAQLLVEEGYAVVSTGDADDALKRCVDGEEFDLLVTDMAMPAMSGRELADRVRVFRPGIKTLFISGYADPAARGRDGWGDETFYLQKPFSSDDLAGAVREVLDQKRTAA